jgi:hypothetical protein
MNRRTAIAQADQARISHGERASRGRSEDGARIGRNEVRFVGTRLGSVESGARNRGSRIQQEAVPAAKMSVI